MSTDNSHNLYKINLFVKNFSFQPCFKNFFKQILINNPLKIVYAYCIYVKTLLVGIYILYNIHDERPLAQ